MKSAGGKTVSHKMIAAIVIVCIAVVGVIVGIVVNSKGEKAFRNISVLDVIGKVTVYRESVGEKINAYADMDLESGDDIKVKKESELDLKLDDDKFVYVDENSHIWMEAEGKQEDSKTVIHMEEGTTLHKIDKKLKGKSSYEVETPNATMAIRGTIMDADVYYDEEGIVHSDFAFYEGSGLLQLHTIEGEPIGEPIEVPQGYCCMTKGDMNFSEIILQKVEDTDEKIVPINYSQVTPWKLEKLMKFVEDGRIIYSGEKSMTPEELKAQLENEEQEGPEKITYEVTFTYGSKIFATQKVEEGNMISKPMLQPTEGAGNWCDSNGAKYDFSKPITEDMTLSWKEN